MSELSPFRVRELEHRYPSSPEIFCDLVVEELTPGNRVATARSNIPAGTVIFKDGGVVVSSIADVEDKFRYAVLVDEGVWLAPRDYSNMDATCFLNHSCSANVARIGALVYIAKRPIAAGESLTIDYATLTSDYDGWSLDCKCGEPNCRKRITSQDYSIPHLAKALWSEWLPFIQKKLLKLEIV